MKTRNEIVTQMCYTWRHDYGIVKTNERKYDTDYSDMLTSGMYQSERDVLRKQMEQIYDNVFAPLLEENNERP